MILPLLGGTPAVWNTCMVFFQAALLAVCARAVWQASTVLGPEEEVRKPQAKDRKAVPALSVSRPPMLTRLHWVALAFVPSSLMLGVTTHISLDIAAIPLLWVIPLSLYLLSFILVFARWPAGLHRVMVLIMPLAVLLLVFVYVSEIKLNPLIWIAQ